MKIILLTLLLLLSSCDDFVEVSSTNEPKTDQEALKLAGITYSQQYEFIDFEFIPGFQDDGMNIIFDIPKENLDWLWYHSPFEKDERIEINEGNQSIIRVRGNSKKWEAVNNVKNGWFSETRHNHSYSLILITEHENKYRCYLNWFEM